MEMESPLPAQTEATAAPEPATGATDGLAAELADQVGAGSSPGQGLISPAGGKKRGRPPIHGLFSKAAGSDGHRPGVLPGPGTIPEGQNAGPDPTRVSIPEDLLAQLVSETLSVGENFAAWKISAVAGKAGLSSGEIKPQLERTQIGERRKAIIADLTPYALQEWGLDPQISPTAAIALILGPWVFASVSAYWTLASLAAERLAMQRAREKLDAKEKAPP